MNNAAYTIYLESFTYQYIMIFYDLYIMILNDYIIYHGIKYTIFDLANLLLLEILVVVKFCYYK